jgi:hypothetical protein
MNSETVSNSTTHNVLALDLRYDNSGNSGAQFERDVASGNNDVTAKIGDLIDPLGSAINSQGMNLQQGIQDRITRAAGAPWNDTGSNYTYPNYPAGNPRVIYILVGADGYEANNSNPKLNLTYYAPAYITGPVVRTQGNNATAFLSVRLLPGNLASVVENLNGATWSDSGTDTGISALRLLG